MPESVTYVPESTNDLRNQGQEPGHAMGTQVVRCRLILELETQQRMSQERRKLSEEVVNRTYCGAPVVECITCVNLSRSEALYLVTKKPGELSH